MYIEHENEILGTIMAVLFALVAIAFISLFWTNPATPLWLAIVGTVILGSVSVWGIWKVGKYWYERLKNKYGKK